MVILGSHAQDSWWVPRDGAISYRRRRYGCLYPAIASIATDVVVGVVAVIFLIVAIASGSGVIAVMFVVTTTIARIITIAAMNIIAYYVTLKYITLHYITLQHIILSYIYIYIYTWSQSVAWDAVALLRLVEHVLRRVRKVKQATDKVIDVDERKLAVLVLRADAMRT